MFFQWSAITIAVGSQLFRNQTNLDVFSRFQIVFDKMETICPDFTPHLKSGLFSAIQKSRLVQISDPHHTCIVVVAQNRNTQILNQSDYQTFLKVRV